MLPFKRLEDIDLEIETFESSKFLCIIMESIPDPLVEAESRLEDW